MREVRDPRLPTPEEVEEHYIRGHIPYRDWCQIMHRLRVKVNTIIRIRGHNGCYQNMHGIIVPVPTKREGQGKGVHS